MAAVAHVQKLLVHCEGHARAYLSHGVEADRDHLFPPHPSKACASESPCPRGRPGGGLDTADAQKGGRTSEARPSEMKLFATDRIVEYSSSGGTCEVKPAHVTQQ